jgi:acyl-CoA synthetase (AMP-forming)/AMP-acid ligase II
METGILNTFFSPQDHVDVLRSGDERRLQSCGCASPFVRIEIMDESGAIMPPETPGEIVVQSDQTMLGYYKNPEETARISVNGWRRTGDIGFKDSEGWLFLVDRKRDMIISGGFNIFPAEIEKILIGHPAVQDCAVIGAPRADWGEAVTAVIELKPECSAEPDAIKIWARAHLSGHMTPKQIHIWPELPRSAAGKVLRRKVRDHFWQNAGRKI